MNCFEGRRRVNTGEGARGSCIAAGGIPEGTEVLERGAKDGRVVREVWEAWAIRYGGRSCPACERKKLRERGPRFGSCTPLCTDH